MKGNRSLLFDRVLPMGMIGLSLVAAYRGQTLAAVLVASLLVDLLVTRFWSSHALVALSFDRLLSDDRAFPGDTVHLVLQVENRKFLPLTWLEIRDQFPSSLPLLDRYGCQDGVLKHTTAVSWNQAAGWDHRILCERRGIYELGPAELVSGDPFGLFPVRISYGATSRLVIYPRLVPVEGLLASPDLPQGGQKPERWIFEDPSRTIGAREYRRGDSLRRIHWKASARRTQILARVYEPSTEVEIALVLALGTFPFSDAEAEVESDPFELGVSTVASLGRHFTERGFPVGLYVNGGDSEAAGTLEVAPASGSAQVLCLLEALARLTSSVAVEPEAYLADIVPRLPWGTSVVVVAGTVSDSLRVAVAAIRGAGRKVETIRIMRGENDDVAARQPVQTA